MEAIILVGGKGTRLRPLTVNTPKPMLPMAGVPFLTHMLARAKAAGVDHIVLATSYRAEVFEQHFGDGAAMGLRIDYATEKVPLGTGGGIRNVAHLLDGEGPVFIFNGDVISGSDLTAQLALHESAGADVTLHLTEVPDPRAFGVVPLDADGRVLQFLEKTPNPPTNLINAGCYLFSRGVFDQIPAGRPVSVERETFPGLLEAGARVFGYVDSSYWLDVGTPEAFVRCSADLVRGIAPSPVIASPSQARIAPDASVDPGARIEGGATIGSGVRVGSGAVVDGAVVFAGATIAADAVVERSVVGARAQVGERTVVREAVIGDDARVGADNELLAGVRIGTGAQLADIAVRFSSDQS